MTAYEDQESQAAAGQSAGQLLAAARNRAGLSVDEVATQLRLAPRQVRAIEADDFDALPGRAIARGFVRNYARLLGLEAQEVLALSPALCPDQGGSLVARKVTKRIQIHDDQNFMGRRKAGRRKHLLTAGIIVAVLAAAAYVWSQMDEEAPVAAAPATRTAPAPVAQPVILTPVAPDPAGSGGAMLPPLPPPAALDPAAAPTPAAAVDAADPTSGTNQPPAAATPGN